MRETVYWLHVVAPFAASWLFVVHRLSGRKIRWKVGVRWAAVDVVVALGATARLLRNTKLILLIRRMLSNLTKKTLTTASVPLRLSPGLPSTQLQLIATGTSHQMPMNLRLRV